MKAILFGASGLVGSSLLTKLVESEYYQEVIVFVRIKLSIQNKKVEQIVTDYSSLHQYASMLENADVYCCLGTTIKKVNYNKEAFKEADLYYPLAIAQNAIKFSANQFHKAH